MALGSQEGERQFGFWLLVERTKAADTPSALEHLPRGGQMLMTNVWYFPQEKTQVQAGMMRNNPSYGSGTLYLQRFIHPSLRGIPPGR